VSDEYRRVLHEWARSHMPEQLRDRPIVDVQVETDMGRQWSEITVEDASMYVRAVYLDESGSRDTTLMDIDLEDGGVKLSALLRDLFKLADQGR